jgi:hypothetical protein
MLGSFQREDIMNLASPKAEQIIKILDRAEKGAQMVGAICREHGISGDDVLVLVLRLWRNECR